jgi:phosphatidylglycerol---prolipoprotein diacylglyceryl transferase
VRVPQGAPPTSVGIIERDFGITVDPALIQKYGDIVPVHPTQLYEVAISTLIFFALWRIRKHPHQAGWLFAVWLACAGAERFFVEIFRAKDDRFFAGFTMAQMISLALIATGIALAMKLSKARPTTAAKSAKPRTA